MAYFHKFLHMKDLRQITVAGLGLLGGSITLRILRSLPGIKTIGYTQHPPTRAKARQLAIAAKIVNDIRLRENLQRNWLDAAEKNAV
jgi:prephenate dehydrogenase